MKKILAIMLAMLMVMSVFSVNVFAAEDNETTEDTADSEEVVIYSFGKKVINNAWNDGFIIQDAEAKKLVEALASEASKFEMVYTISKAIDWCNFSLNGNGRTYVDGDVSGDSRKTDLNAGISGLDTSVGENKVFTLSGAALLKFFTDMEGTACKGLWSSTGDTNVGDTCHGFDDINNIKGIQIQPSTGDGAFTVESIKVTVAPIAAGGVGFDTLQAAVDATDNGLIKVSKSLTGAGVVVPAGKNITIDFGGNTYTVNSATVGSTGTETNGFQLRKGATVTLQNGTLTDKTAKILIQNYADLTLDNMNVVSPNAGCVVSNNNGKLNVIGNTSIKAAEGKTAFDMYYWPKNGYDTINVTVNTTGTIEGNIEISADGSADFDTVVSKLSLDLQAGTFKGNFVVDADALKYEYKAETPDEPEPEEPKFEVTKFDEEGIELHDGGAGVKGSVKFSETGTYTISANLTQADSTFILKGLGNKGKLNLPAGIEVRITSLKIDGKDYTINDKYDPAKVTDKFEYALSANGWGVTVISDDAPKKIDSNVSITFEVVDPNAKPIVPEPKQVNLFVYDAITDENGIELFNPFDSAPEERINSNHFIGGAWTGKSYPADFLTAIANENALIEVIASEATSNFFSNGHDYCGGHSVDTERTEADGKVIEVCKAADVLASVFAKTKDLGNISNLEQFAFNVRNSMVDGVCDPVKLYSFRIYTVEEPKTDVPAEPTEADKKAALYKALGEKAVKIAEGTKFTDADVKLFGVKTFEVNGVTVVGVKPTSTKTGVSAYLYVNEEYHGMVLDGHLICQPHDADNAFDYCPICHAIIEKDEEVEIDVVDPTEAGDVKTEDDELTISVTEPEPEKPAEEKNPPMGLALAVLPMALAAAALAVSKRR